jgi:membrane-associated phospholipid phosphatase
MEHATTTAPRARLTRLELGLAALAVAFTVLAVLVAGGTFSTLDHFAVVHLMPSFDPSKANDTIPSIRGAFVPFGLDPAPWWKRGLDAVMYPASILVSLTIFAVGCAVLWRRGAKVAAVVWGAAWFVANAVEVGVKAAIEKPALHDTKDGVSYHLASFDHSFPSGHAMRAVLVAAVVLYVWRRLGVVAAVWALALPFCLVAASWHVPSDVVGGFLFGSVAALTAVAAIAAVSARRAAR